jgi:hypothetical protein
VDGKIITQLYLSFGQILEYQTPLLLRIEELTSKNNS